MHLKLKMKEPPCFYALKYIYKNLIIIIASIIATTVLVNALFFPANDLSKLINTTQFQKNKIYLVLRGTKSKAGIIAKDYNTYINSATHIAIGLVENGELHVYHISDEISDRGDNFFHETIFQFIDRNDLYYLSIWELEKTDIQIVSTLKKELEREEKKMFYFDHSLLLKNDKYYCSEWINSIFEQQNLTILKKKKIKLNTIPKMYLKRDSLEYYPVDSFVENKNIIRILDWRK